MIIDQADYENTKTIESLYLFLSNQDPIDMLNKSP